MKKMYKAMLLVLCAVMLMAGSVLGTLAYLKAETGPITNTMTVGKVAITLNETDVDEYGVKDGDTRVTENTYKLIPGHTYVKDPTITVAAGSEACYLFVKVENGIVDIEDQDKTIASQMDANGWEELDASDDIWYKPTAVDARDAADDISVAIFTSFTIDGTAEIADYAGETIAVTAYAVQAEGFDDADSSGTAADEAWAATFGEQATDATTDTNG